MLDLPSVLQALSQDGIDTLRGIKRGMEKEALRITEKGKLAQTSHPQSLGSALTHPCITTDFSEALLEFITPPCNSIDNMLNYCDEIHRFTCQQIQPENELLWMSSMPCVIGKDSAIPIAQYGSSNNAKMKVLYREGLSHRYGRSMQVISGIHYNFSFPDTFWEALKKIETDSSSLQDYKTQKYFGLIRNFRRYFWLLLYLFGAAPALCPTFIKNRKHNLQELNNSLYSPYATSLRMGDLGYQSKEQENLFVDYNSLDAYIKTLFVGLTSKHGEYDKPEAKQLNSNLLQIENEFYSAIRPKQIALPGEAPIVALKKRGVEYIEVRSVDINPFDPLGIDTTQAHFIEGFLLFCLLEPSSPSSPDEYKHILNNQHAVVNNGRDPNLSIYCHGKKRPLRDCGKNLLDKIHSVSSLLTAGTGESAYLESLTEQYEKIKNSDLTPSSKIIKQMQKDNISFYELILKNSQQHCDDFTSRPLPLERKNFFKELGLTSLEKQKEIEQGSTVGFEQYLDEYFQQYKNLNS